MKNVESIHQLIHSLSKAEKRHFKMTAARYSKDQNNYLLLFDAIDKQEVYDEDKLKRKFKTQSFGKSIGKTKYLLNELLLKSLRPLYNSKNTKTQLQGLLQSIDFLISKCLYDQALAQLRKVKRQAIHFQLYPIYLEVLSYEIRLSGFGLKSNNAKQINGSMEEYNRVAEWVRVEMRYQVASKKLETLQLTNEFPVWKNALEEITEHLPVEDTLGYPTFLSLIFQKEIASLAAKAKGDSKKTLSLQFEIFELWKTKQHLIPVFNEIFVRTNHTHLQFLLQKIGEEDRIQEVLAFLKKHQLNGTPEEKIKANFQQQVAEFIVHLNQGNTEICALMILELKDNREDFEDVASHPMQVQLYYHIAIYYFLKKDFDEALNWVMATKAVGKEKYFPRALRFTQLIELIARFELGEYDYLDSAIRTQYRLLRQEEGKNEMEKLVLKSVRKLINASQKTEVNDIFNTLYNSLKKLKSNTSHNRLQTDLLFRWIDKYLSQETIECYN